jgi:hypothetical protein
VLKSVMTAALHQGTLISFRRVSILHVWAGSHGQIQSREKPMLRKRKSNPKTGACLFSCLNLNAAGVDIGATEIYIAGPGDRDPQPVRCFPTFTEDLHAAAAWLNACHIETAPASRCLFS